MKILVVCQYYYPEPFRITDICEELSKRGNQVTVLTGLPNYPEGEVLKEYKKKEHKDEMRNGVRILRCYEHGRGKNALHMLCTFSSFGLSGKKKIKSLDKDFDVVFINQFSPVMMAWPGIKYAKKYNKKCVLYCYDLWPASLSAGGIKKDSFIYKFFGKISKKIYNNADLIGITSKEFSGYFEDTHSIPKEKLFYLPQYCEDLFSDTTSRINDGNCNFVFAGNIGKMQSVETILKAAELLKEDKKIFFHIVGDGRDLENCKHFAEERNLTNVIFYGRKPVNDMPKFYSIADAMIVTLSKDELVSKTLPGKMQSYMAAGKPIIACADGEIKTIINEAKCGLCCEAEDYKEFSNLFTYFANHLEIAIDMGQNSKLFFEKYFKKEMFFEKLTEIFNEVTE